MKFEDLLYSLWFGNDSVLKEHLDIFLTHNFIFIEKKDDAYFFKCSKCHLKIETNPDYDKLMHANGYNSNPLIDKDFYILECDAELMNGALK